jgi:hypothetical protein
VEREEAINVPQRTGEVPNILQACGKRAVAHWRYSYRLIIVGRIREKKNYASNR